MKKQFFVPLSIVAFSLVACNDVTNTYKVTLDKHQLTLVVNKSDNLTATIEGDDLLNPRLVWTISDNEVATFNDGVITGLKEGSTEIKVFIDLNENTFYDIGEPFDECSISVLAPTSEFVPVSSVSLNENTLNLLIDDTYTLQATVLPENASDKSVSWLSSDESVVSVNNGILTALKEGDATITAYVDVNKNGKHDLNEKSANTLVKVTTSIVVPEPILVEKVTINAASISVQEGSDKIVYATVLPTDASYKTITWLSSNTSIATVNTGKVLGVKPGTVTITAYVDENQNKQLDSSEKSATLSLTVTAKPNTSEPDTDPIPASGQMLPIGNRTVTGPSNLTPIDINEWVNFDITSSLPNYWSYIMGNNKRTTGGDFYAISSGGGFKFSQLYYGLQSPLINSWLKTEVRLTISQVNNNSENVSKHKDKPIFHVYMYDITGQYIAMETVEQMSNFASRREISFYLRNTNMAYFEIRLNAQPYKSSQCYNFGVSQISIKGWNYA